MRGLVVVALLALLSACQAPPPAEMTQGEIAQIEEAVLAQANALIETQNAFDAAGVLELFSDQDMDWMNGSIHYTSYDAVAGVVEGFFEGLDEFDSGWKSLSVKVISKDAALCQGEWWGEQTRGGIVTRYDSTFFTALYELQPDGSWKITRVHQSWADPVTEG